ncbi:MAG: two-component system, NarL family, nitrate/nitrite response regulator NarL [Solirubrobacteraceae bacterium]|jgi:DNA-binding NarL/FixJ family response regulator|nr:two-component system, NarL family, nitrate/nitrite response regulator NarL [Solirubrobacteraceae bacterium]
MKRLLIVGDEGFTVHAMRYAMQHTTGFSLFGVIESNGDVRSAVRMARPDAVVLDGLSADNRALDCLVEIRAELPTAFVLLVVAQMSAADTERALQAGGVICMWPDVNIASGEGPEAPSMPATAPPQPAVPLQPAIPLQPPVEIAAERAPAHGPLTSREMETLRWVAEGHTNAWIARKLWVTEQTVKFHLTNIYRKLDVANRTEASHYALVNGLLATPAQPARDAGLLRGPGDALAGALSSRGGDERNGHVRRRPRES